MLLPRCHPDGSLLLLLLALLDAAQSTSPLLGQQQRTTHHSTTARLSTSSRATTKGLLFHSRAPFGLSKLQVADECESSSSILTIARLRGGAQDDDEEDETSSSSSDDETSSDSTAEEDSDESDDSTDDDDDETKSATTAAPPVAVTLKTATGSKLLDQSIELPTVHRSRDVASLKLSVSRQLPSRPPVAAIQLTLHGKILDDSVLVDDLLEDEEDEDEDDSANEEEGLVLQLDMIPTVDPKFIYELDQKIQDMTAAELLEAYSVNEAAVYQNTALLMKEEQQQQQQQQTLQDGDDEPVQQQQPAEPVNIQIWEQAARIRQDLENTLLQTPHAQELLADPLAPSARHQHAVVEVKGQRVRRPGTTGVKGSWKRVIQHNLNVDWPVTIRHFLCFLFFGFFGGRTATSRAILLLGAPSIFVLQVRPVKLWLRQAIYTVLDHPPSIFLSLLPAPQQAILSLNVDKAMQTVYGEHVLVADSSSSTAAAIGLDDHEGTKSSDEDETTEDYDSDDDYEDDEDSDDESDGD